MLTTYLIEDFVDYGLDLAIQSVPIPEAKPHEPPKIVFFDVVKQVHRICYLYESQLHETLHTWIM